MRIMKNDRESFVKTIKEEDSYKEAYEFVSKSFFNGEIVNQEIVTRRFRTKYPDKKLNEILLYKYDILMNSLMQEGKVRKFPGLSESDYIITGIQKQNKHREIDEEVK